MPTCSSLVFRHTSGKFRNDIQNNNTCITRELDMLLRLGHPLNSQWRPTFTGTKNTCLCLWIPKEQRRDKLLLGHTPNITKKGDEHSYSPMSYFDITQVFSYFCSRDKADRHTPILIEDENLFTAFDDLPLDDT